jgi:hypothetical protein
MVEKGNFMKKASSLLILSSLLMTAACGDTTGERAVSGAGIGAGAGAVAGVLTGGSIGGAALLGGAAGAATGALTDKSQINLGH